MRQELLYGYYIAKVMLTAKQVDDTERGNKNYLTYIKQLDLEV